MLWTLLGLGHDTLLAFFPFLACIFSLFSLHFRSCTFAPSVYMQQQRKHKASRQAKDITKKQRKHTKEQTRNESTQRGKQAYYQSNKQERVSQKDKCRFGFGDRSSIMLEYGRHMCHQAKFLKGTQDFVYKDECEPTQNHRQELSLMTRTSIQRHMHEHICKDEKNQRKTKQDGTKQACYHTKGKGKHVIRHIQRIT